MQRKKVIVTVTNDLFTDRRVDKVCRYLTDKGAEVLLVGRRLPSSPEIPPRPYQTHRMKLYFEKGALFYAEYNFRLFFFLLFHPFDFLVSNDLDTLPACDFAAASKGKKLVYDSHEYFTEVPELQHRPVIKKIWEILEIMCLRNVERMYTVNDSIAAVYSKKYNKTIGVVRNVPEASQVSLKKNKRELGLPEDKHLLILQGAGINIDRGAEELLEAMRNLDDCFLVIVGAGDAFPSLSEKVRNDSLLKQRVVLINRLPYEEMMQYTLLSEIGFSLDKDSNPNYRFSLPNKLFDYFKAGVAVVATDLVEIGKVIRTHQSGVLIDRPEPMLIVQAVRSMLDDPQKLNQLRNNARAAADFFTWENEKITLDKVYHEWL